MLTATTTRRFFSLPSLAFFDATNFKPRNRINITPGNYSETISHVMKDDWTLVPQPRPATTSTFLFINKQNKVLGRFRPPYCVPFPRRGVRADGGITKEHLLNYVQSNDGTWLLVCTNRAVGCVVVDKTGAIDGDYSKVFPLLIDNGMDKRGGQEYDSPGFVRPGNEAPIFANFYSWVSEHAPRLDACVNWAVRRDDPHYTMWESLRYMMRSLDSEFRFEHHNAAVTEQLQAIGGADEDGAVSAGSSSSAATSSLKKYLKPSDERGEMFGGHAQGTPEAMAAASQFALERRSILENPKWTMIPPFVMPQQEIFNSRRPDDINIVSAVGRMRQGVIELI